TRYQPDSMNWRSWAKGRRYCRAARSPRSRERKQVEALRTSGSSDILRVNREFGGGRSTPRSSQRDFSPVELARSKQSGVTIVSSLSTPLPDGTQPHGSRFAFSARVLTTLSS